MAMQSGKPPRWLDRRENGLGSCWGFRGAKNRSGYGMVSYEGRSMPIHRAAYLYFIGPIGDGLTIDHVKTRGCFGPPCWNPDHLEAISRKEQERRKHNKPPADTSRWAAFRKRLRDGK